MASKGLHESSALLDPESHDRNCYLGQAFGKQILKRSTPNRFALISET